MKTNGGRAFPGYEHVVAMDRNDPEKTATVVTQQPHGGMSLRDYFAAHALVMVGALAASRATPDMTAQDKLAGIADMAYTVADFMLAEREK